MVSVCVCGGCGRTIEKDYIFCPWCGRSRMMSGCKETIDSAFDRMEEIQDNKRIRQLEEMEQRLLTLEKELDCLVTSVEMHK